MTAFDAGMQPHSFSSSLVPVRFRACRRNFTWRFLTVYRACLVTSGALWLRNHISHIGCVMPTHECIYSFTLCTVGAYYCTISTYSSPLVTCDRHKEMSISSVPEMRCDNFDISSLVEIWHWESPKILTHNLSFNQTPYLTVFLGEKTKNKYSGCYCSSSQSIKPLTKHF